MSHAAFVVTTSVQGESSALPPSQAAPSCEGWKSLFLMRLPVFDMGRQTAGYELLAQACAQTSPQRSPQIEQDAGVDPETLLIRQSIHELIHVVGLDVFLGQTTLFIPMTLQNLLQEDFMLLPPAQTCMMLPVACASSPELLEICQRARQCGYRFLIDFSAGTSHCSELMEVAQFVRVHYETTPHASIQTLVQKQNADGPAVICQGIDSTAAMEQATAWGIRYVQGRFFCQAEQIRGKELASTHLTQLKFLAQLSKPVLDFDELEVTIKCDVALTCNLLRYMNSAAMGVKRKITSVKQALVLLGEKPMRQWGALIAITALAGEKPHELLVTSLVRARFCETLARRQNMDEQTLDLFLAGLLSTLDVMLDTSMDEALASVPVPQQVRDVLAGDRSSVMGQMLALACAAQRGAWGSVIELANHLHLPHHEMAAQYYQTLQWTHDFFSVPAEA